MPPAFSGGCGTAQTRSISEGINFMPANILVGCGGTGIETLIRLNELLSEDAYWRYHIGTDIYFLNPGREACLDNNRRRPWEPHKYESPEAQDAMLAVLRAWVEEYYTRDDQCSLICHRRVFDSYTGKKTELTGLPAELQCLPSR